MHYWLDVPLTSTMPSPLWHRYADNFCYVVQSVTKGEQALAKVRRLLNPLGMSLKGEDGVSDLAAGEKVHLLGFSVQCLGEEVVYGVGKNATDHLMQRLRIAHEDDNPSRAAEQALLEWIESCGPAFE